MSNCCIRRSAKFHVDSAVGFLAIANIREGALNAPHSQARVKAQNVDAISQYSCCLKIRKGPLIQAALYLLVVQNRRRRNKTVVVTST